MVAKAEWLTVEPDINLAMYLASEEPRFFPSTPLDWMPKDWEASEDELELRYVGDDPPERG